MAEKARKVKYDFFKLSIPGYDEKNVANIFGHKPEYYDKIVNGEGTEIHYHFLRNNDYLISGSLLNNHMVNIPGSFDGSKKQLARLPLTERQGLAYVTAFVFDRELNILMLQSTKNGVTLKGFCHFFELNCNIPEINTSIVLDPNKLDKYNSLTSISKINIKIARINSGSHFDGRDKSLNELNRLADETDTNHLEYILLAERKKSLKISKIKEIVRNILAKKNNEHLEKLIISGKEEGDRGNSIIDLMHAKMQTSLDFTLSRNSDIFVIATTLDRMETEYNRHRPILLKTYKTQ
jgi:hypothetical protein